MKGKLLFSVIALVLAMTVGTVYGATLQVGAGQTYTTIQAAIDAASPGDVINVAAGNYTENLVITKSVTLLGPNANIDPNTGTRVAEAVINGGDGTTIIPQVPNIVINGFTVSSTATGFPIYTGGTDVTGLTISNDIVNGGVRAITVATNGDSISILHSQISGAGYGIHFGNGIYGNLKINNNVVNGPVTYYAIYIHGGGTIVGFELKNNMVYWTGNIAANISNGTVSGNTFDVNSGDLNLQINLHNSVMSGNTFEGHGTTAGLQLFGSQYSSFPSDTVTLSGNTFSNCGANTAPWNYAIQLSQDIQNITITDDTITNAYDGVNTRAGTGGAPVSWDLSGNNIHINNSSITGSRHLAVNNTVTGTLDATNNWWGTAASPAALVNGVVFDPWYIDEEMLNLSNAVADADDIAVTIADPPPFVNVAASVTVDISGAIGTGTIVTSSYSADPVTTTTFSTALPGKTALKYVDVQVTGLTSGTAVITVDYSDAEVTAKGLNEDTLILYVWYGGTWNAPVSSPGRDTVNNKIWGTFNVTDLTGAPAAPGGPTGGGAAIPTLSEWGLIFFGLLIGAFAVWSIRRQRYANVA